MGPKSHLWAPRLAGLFGAFLALFIVFERPSIVNIARDRIFDQYQRLSPRAYNQSPVRVVEIDDAALEKYGQWPWPRHRLAEIVHILGEAGAASIVFDIILAEPDRTSPSNVAQSWLNAPALSSIVSDLSTSEVGLYDHDTRLAEELRKNRSVLHLTARANASDSACPPALAVSRVQGMQAEGLSKVALSFRQVIPPLDIFRKAASGEGFARVGLSDDAIVRSAPLIALACRGKEIYPSLAIEALRVGAPYINPQFAPVDFVAASQRGPCRTHVTGIANQSVSEVHLCGLRLPTTEDGQIWIHYSRAESVASRRLSVIEVLEGDSQKLKEQVQGRIVIIGASAEGLRDVLVTPMGDERPGAHIHAEIIEQALAEETLFRAWDLMRPIEIVTASLLVLLLLIFLPKLSAAIGFGIWLTLMAVIFAGSYFSFANSRLLIDPITPGTVLTLSFVGAFVVMFQQEQLARKFIRGAFGRFLSPLILERLERDPSLLKLEGESREITAFFSDIRGFTALSEQLSPQQVTTLLNQYFTPMTRIVVDHKGLVDKYMGDGLAAMWNAPIDVEHHPSQACRAALAMLRALERLNAEWQKNANLPAPEIKIGIGLHTAEARVGNFGSEDHLEYSMLGDMVNLTSRLESLTKQYGASIIISADTWQRAPEFAAVPLGSIIVKGRSDPTVIFALVGDESVAASPAFQRFRTSFEAGVIALEEGDYFAAMDHFGSCQQGDTYGLGSALERFQLLAAEKSEAQRAE